MFHILPIFAYRPIQITKRSKQKRPVKNRSAPAGRDSLTLRRNSKRVQESLSEKRLGNMA
jgi:hypothetical protein